jgi:hypothetical protein
MQITTAATIEAQGKSYGGTPSFNRTRIRVQPVRVS